MTVRGQVNLASPVAILTPPQRWVKDFRDAGWRCFAELGSQVSDSFSRQKKRTLVQATTKGRRGGGVS